MNKKTYLQRAEHWINSGERELTELLSAIRRSMQQLALLEADATVSEDIQRTIEFLKSILPDDVRIKEFNEFVEPEPHSSELLFDLSSLGEEAAVDISEAERKSLFKTLLNTGAVSKGIPSTLKKRKSVKDGGH
ncbi:MAG: hypothetical protein KUG80_03175 [Gammaproteobacteria bacterium]|nr:hypothetical protein [Gammaproteobacteria bacterium]